VIKIHSEQDQSNPSLSNGGKNIHSSPRNIPSLKRVLFVWEPETLPECLVFGLSLICSKNYLLQTYFSLLVAILIHFVRATVDHWVTTDSVCVSKLKGCFGGNFVKFHFFVE
jgi:hypothetical protein